MTRLIKTISLDEETYKIAQSLPNFSEFIRAQLIALEEKRNPKIRYAYACFTCERMFTYATDQGETSLCRSKMCKDYGLSIMRHQA